MTSSQFTTWLKGFVSACNDYAPTPKQWDDIKDKLESIQDRPSDIVSEFPGEGFGYFKYSNNTANPGQDVPKSLRNQLLD